MGIIVDKLIINLKQINVKNNFVKIFQFNNLIEKK